MKHFLSLVTTALAVPISFYENSTNPVLPDGYCINGDYIYQCDDQTDDQRGLFNQAKKWDNWIESGIWTEDGTYIESGIFIIPYFIAFDKTDNVTIVSV